MVQAVCMVMRFFLRMQAHNLHSKHNQHPCTCKELPSMQPPTQPHATHHVVHRICCKREDLLRIFVVEIVEEDSPQPPRLPPVGDVEVLVAPVGVGGVGGWVGWVCGWCGRLVWCVR